jgi:hypothetical protein
MMNKIKDALNNMLSKMKPQDNQQNGNDNQQDGKKGDPADKGQKSSPSKQQDSSEASSKEADNEQGDQSDQSQAGDTKKSSDKSSDSKSGAGSQDGEKALKAAAELKAIGKITELLGKRQQNVTGEVMIEVGNGKQPLKTPWAQRAANHVEAGSEIHRDEIPLTDQLFVQQYFEEVRKPAAAPSKPPAAPKTAPAGK